MPPKGNAPPRTPDCHPERRHLARGLCKQCYDQDYGKRNRNRLNKKAREWAARNPDRIRATRRKYLYGVDAETVAARLAAQDGMCKICVEAPATDLDHDHRTGKARALLCGNCNRALGLFGDDRARLRRAADYLDLWDDRAIQVIPNTGRRADGCE